MKEPVFVTIEGYANCEIVPINTTHVFVDVYEAAVKRAEDETAKTILGTVNQLDLDPPSYLPVREPLQPRIPDLCPDESKDEK